MKACVFLSASVPLPNRDQKYYETADVVAIRESIRALVTATVPQGELVFGGHPAITPLIRKLIQDMQLPVNKLVTLFQSEYFKKEFPPENKDFEQIVIIPEVLNDKDASLRKMRERMISSKKFTAGVFIGGMEGAVEEYSIFRKFHPRVPVYPIASTGAAAAILFEKEKQNPPELLSDLRYLPLFRRLLAEKVVVATTEEAALSSIRPALKHKGFEIIVAKDGDQAIQLARKWQPDFAILDSQLPNVSLHEVQRSIALDIPVLAAEGKSCPKCGQKIDLVAYKCRSCGSSFPRETSPEVGQGFELILQSDDYPQKPFDELPREHDLQDAAVEALIELASNSPDVAFALYAWAAFGTSQEEMQEAHPSITPRSFREALSTLRAVLIEHGKLPPY